MVRPEQLRDVYEASGFQGVFDRWGGPGVEEVLRDWRSPQIRLSARDGYVLTVGADFCYTATGASSYRRLGMGVHFGLSGHGRSGGVFTMHKDDAESFNEGLERVGTNHEDFADTDHPRVHRVDIDNCRGGVHVEQTGGIKIGRGRARDWSEFITITFSPGMFGRPEDSVAIDLYDWFSVRRLVEEALKEVERYERAQGRAERVIRRGIGQGRR